MRVVDFLVLVVEVECLVVEVLVEVGLQLVIDLLVNYVGNKVIQPLIIDIRLMNPSYPRMLSQIHKKSKVKQVISIKHPHLTSSVVMAIAQEYSLSFELENQV